MTAPSSVEELLTIWMDKEPTARSPSGIYGYPPMWSTFKGSGGFELFTRPVKTQTRDRMQNWVEVDGVQWQWNKDGKWYDQGYSGTFENFFNLIKRVQENRFAQTGQIAVLTSDCIIGTQAFHLAF